MSASPSADLSRPGRPKILKLLFVALLLGALGLVGWHTLYAWMTERRHVRREIPQLRADVIGDLEDIGLARSPIVEDDGSIRFGHPPSMTSEDILLLLRRIMQTHGLVMTAAVKYAERGQLYVELSSSRQHVVVRFIFSPGLRGEMLAGVVRGRIGIIIDDFGYVRNRLTAGFMALGEKLTLSVIPGHRYSQNLADEAVQAGHEVMLHIPMEPENYNGRDEEEFILLYGMDSDEAQARIRRAFQELTAARGANNHEGSLATLDTVLMAVLARELKSRNKYFVDSFTTPDTRALDVMASNGVSALGRQVFLDNVDDPAYIRSQLAELASWAESSGSAIGIGHVGASHLNTLEVLAEEMPKLRDRGFEFVFISELME